MPTGSPEPGPDFRRRRPLAWAGLILGLLLLLAVVRLLTIRLTKERIRESVVATIQREAEESFLVTGSLDLTATTTIENTRLLFPGALDISLGTSRATVQVPGRAFYGFDVRTLKAEHIDIRGDTVGVTVPEPVVLSTAANLEQLKVWSSQGWLRTPASVRTAEQSALRRVQAALDQQAAQHVRTSVQPHLNSARALEKMLTPSVQAAGLRKPVFRFQIGRRLIMEGSR